MRKRTEKPLLITRSYIRVSANPHSPRGWLAFHETRGILPGCRKIAHLTVSPCYSAVSVRNLFSYNGYASIHPDTWGLLIESSPIVSDPMFPIELTPELLAIVRAEAVAFTTCPAITSEKDVAEEYRASMKWDSIELVPGCFGKGGAMCQSTK